MIALGLTGGIDAAHENVYNFPFDFIHDAAAALVRDGEVLAAIELERLNRIKHTNKSPGPAARFCLEQAGIKLSQVDAFAFYASEEYCDRLLEHLYLKDLGLKELLTGRTMVASLLEREFETAIDPARIRFIPHHHAHAVGAYFQSGYDQALVVTLDGQGERVSGTVFLGQGNDLRLLRSLPEEQSLGFFYRDVIRFLGYEMFDEYKVMGMAPYGKPERHRKLFSSFYELLPDGEYRLHLDRIPLLHRYVRPRRKGQPFTSNQQDVAAALQEALETVARHLLKHFQAKTGQRRLCLAGGVAHNCSLNGQILSEGLFDQLFVHPAAHDAGCAVGAALAANLQDQPGLRPAPLTHVYWGSEPGGDEALQKELTGWGDLVTFEKRPDLVPHSAGLMAEGKVFGWVEGRSEFGPRALGHRSILADPRPAANKDIVNRMVKKREAYRPFAPSVLEERAGEFFVLPAGQKQFPYMTVVLEVRPEQRAALGAITHVDGTARIQTVSRSTSPRYWELIEAFGRLTGVPILLNTSFNNHAEPIVDSAREAIACFLTTGLHYLVIGDYFISKRPADATALLGHPIELPDHLAVRKEKGRIGSAWAFEHRAFFTHEHGKASVLTSEAYALLERADGRTPAADLALAAGIRRDDFTRLAEELSELWSHRMVRFLPRP